MLIVLDISFSVLGVLVYRCSGRDSQKITSDKFTNICQASGVFAETS